MQIILSTRNPSKAEQIKRIFDGTGINILTLEEAGIDGEAVEDGETLRENAAKKARYAFAQSPDNTWAIADDTGIFINALDGRPGVKSARWCGDDATTEQIMEKTLEVLSSKTDRSAKFQTDVFLIDPSGWDYYFTGSVNGKILTVAQCKPQPKMPYSPIFVPDGSEKTWAEMTVDEENALSHRGIAFRAAREFLEQFLLK